MRSTFRLTGLMPALFASAVAIVLSACNGTICPLDTYSDGGFSGRVVGCGDFVVARQSFDSLSILHVRSLPSHFTHERDTAYEVALSTGSSIVVYIERFARPQDLQSQVCDDVGGDDAPLSIDTVTSGLVSLRAYDFSQDGFFRTFRVDVDLRNLGVDSLPLLDWIYMDSVLVGWLPG